MSNSTKYGSITDLCPLCSAATEDSVPLFAECDALGSVRQRYLGEIGNELTHRNQSAVVANVMNEKVVLTQLGLDCTSAVVASKVFISLQESTVVERITKRLSFALHLKHCCLLAQPV